MEICSVDGCEEEVYCKTICRKHYMKEYYLKNKEKLRDYAKEYFASDKGKEVRNKYINSENGKKLINKYRTSEEYKELHKKVKKKYYTSENGKRVLREYQTSDKGKDATSNARNKRRLRMYSGGYEIFSRYEVFDKCLWVCALCGEPVDKDLVHPDPMSASLDHILPLSKGGEHSFENCQLAHLVCNKKKGNRIET